MSTINPLFSDSTKPVGDKCVTNFELYDIALCDDDHIYVEISDGFEFSQRFRLLNIPTKKTIKHKVEIWLPKKTKFFYRFIVETRKEKIYTSKIQEMISGQDIIEKWDPWIQTESEQENTDKHRLIKKSFYIDKTQNTKQSIKSNFQKPLCKPQSLDEIEGLLKELI